MAAFIDGRRVIRYTDLDRQSGSPRFYHNLVPKVFLLKLIPGMEPDILQYVGERYEAVVIESYGVGGLPFVDRRNFLDQLESLTAKGRIVVIATQVTLEGSDARFDHTLVPHGHGRCRECGRVCDIFLADFAAIGRDAVCGGFQVEGWDVEFTGLCEECSKKQMRQGAKEE